MGDNLRDLIDDVESDEKETGVLKEKIEKLQRTIQKQKIVISDLRHHVFYATLHLSLNGRVIEIDARPSDAIALGAASNAPIYVADHVFEQASQ